MNRRTRTWLVWGAALLVLVALGWWAQRDFGRESSGFEMSVSTPVVANAEAVELRNADAVGTGLIFDEALPTPPVSEEAADARQALEQAPPTRIYGVVSDRLGTPLNEVQVVLRGTQSRRRVSCMTNSAGEFSVAEIPFDEYSVWMIAAQEEANLPGPTISPEKPVVRLDLTFSRIQEIVLNWVLPDGTPIHRELREREQTRLLDRTLVFASIEDEEPEAQSFRNLASRIKQAQKPGRVAPIEQLGTIRIRSERANRLHLTLCGRQLASLAFGPSTTELEFVVPLDVLFGAESRLRVQPTSAATGEPIPASVTLGPGHGPHRPFITERVAPAAEVRLDLLTAGPTTVSISSIGFATLHRLVTLLPGETLDLGMVALLEPARIEGRVLFDAATLETEAFVRSGQEQPDGTIHWNPASPTYDGGLFEQGTLEPGLWAIQSVDPFVPYPGHTPLPEIGRLTDPPESSPVVWIDTTAGAVLDVKLYSRPR